MKNVRILIAAVVLSLTCTSCLGPNNLGRSIRNWNAEVTSMDWANEAIFLGLNIIPVYSFAYLGDVLILNTIDYWAGENPMSDPGLFPSSFGDGK